LFNKWLHRISPRLAVGGMPLGVQQGNKKNRKSMRLKIRAAVEKIGCLLNSRRKEIRTEFKLEGDHRPRQAIL